MVKIEFHDPSGSLEVTTPHAPRLVSHPPACTFILLPVLAGPGARFQIDVTAAA